MVGDLKTKCPSLEHFMVAGTARSGWQSLNEAMVAASPRFTASHTAADEPAICYYTSGTTREPKAVLHSHAYTYSHRFTGLNWLGLDQTDRHWTTSDTGWAKAAYGVLFGPWMNGVTDFHVQRPLRAQEGTRADATLSDHEFLRAAHRVPDAGQGGPRRAIRFPTCAIAPAPASRSILK